MSLESVSIGAKEKQIDFWVCIPYFQFECVKVYLLGKTWTLQIDCLNSKSANFTINTAADLTD